jgi:hypothetical protein
MIGEAIQNRSHDKTVINNPREGEETARDAKLTEMLDR